MILFNLKRKQKINMIFKIIGLSHALIYFPLYEYMKERRREKKGKELGFDDIFFISTFCKRKHIKNPFFSRSFSIIYVIFGCFTSSFSLRVKFYLLVISVSLTYPHILLRSRFKNKNKEISRN